MVSRQDHLVFFRHVLKVKKLLRTAYRTGWVFCTIILGEIQFGNRSDRILPGPRSGGTCGIALTFSL